MHHEHWCALKLAETKSMKQSRMHEMVQIKMTARTMAAQSKVSGQRFRDSTRNNAHKHSRTESRAPRSKSGNVSCTRSL
jgi:hypothetical protein